MTNLVKAVNFVLMRTCHLPILVIFLAKFYRLATLMPRIGLRQVKQIEMGHVYIEKLKKDMDDNTRRIRLMNAKSYSQNLKTFWVTEYIDYRVGVSSRSYKVDL
ncbi:hypothetical protein J1N35_005072 [Gossypium stocksii]|uniref:Uncharacterized protein n=1 Tax=Gossypium stocksii TaxID=47602 RepID=A0A9D3WE02_9ROSI|nr:hypothetical protein J1N35_005072 [Gossypium stocksii]